MSGAELFERIERRQALVFNERTKLVAGSLDRLSTASVVAGFIGPIASSSATGSMAAITQAVVISTLTWLFAAFLLHFAARQMLGKLKL